MPSSQIKLIESTSGKTIAAAPNESVLLSSANLGWRGIKVEQHNLNPTELPEHYVDGHRLIVHTGKPILYGCKDGKLWRENFLTTGDFCLLSHGELYQTRWTENLQVIAIGLEPDFISRVFEDAASASRNISFTERLCQHDETISRFAAYFRAELHNASYQGTLFGESLAMAFALHLLEKHGRIQKPLKMPHGKLSAKAGRRALEFVHENLAENLSIETVAAQANMSAFHFARLFKNTIGLTPHQYILQSRIERAKRLILTAPRPNLTEIGLSLGFFDQTHFTKVFRRTTGVTPKVFLKQAE